MSTIYFAMDPVKSLNPLSSQDRDVYYISQLMFSSLFKLNENLNIEPDLVSSYTANSGSGTVSIKLREDAKFSDGSRVTAEDVRYTVSQILRIGDESPYYEYASKIDSVKTSGSYSLTITFENPNDAASIIWCFQSFPAAVMMTPLTKSSAAVSMPMTATTV